MTKHVTHTLEPVFNTDSKILILGTMPSPKSREVGFYYTHPQNRFWRVLAELLREPLPETNDERRSFLLRHRIALWDVLASCQIESADDSSIRQPRANDLNLILKQAPIKKLFTTGSKAAQLYKSLCYPQTGLAAVALPSTSPANCRFYQYQDILNAYAVILDEL